MSSGLTRAQEAELRRRLGALQTRFAALSQETNLRTSALENIATEVFGAQPDLDFDTYLSVIENGARELNSYIAAARSRTSDNPEVAALRQRAIFAAEQGHLSQARALYDEIIEINREDRQRQRHAYAASDASDVAESARLASVAADYLEAARRYGLAAEHVAASDPHARWGYLLKQADELSNQGETLGQPAHERAAVQLLREALSLVPRSTSASDWATTQAELSEALRSLGAQGDSAALEQSVAAARSALEVDTAQRDRLAKARDQYLLALALYTTAHRSGRHTQAGVVMLEAFTVLNEALEVHTIEETPLEWASDQVLRGHIITNMKTVLLDFEGNFPEVEVALEAYNQALRVYTRSTHPRSWATIQLSLGRLATRGNQGDAQQRRQIAESAYRSALEIYTRDQDPMSWAIVQGGLANLYLSAGQFQEALASSRQALEIITPENGPSEWSSLQYIVAKSLWEMGGTQNRTEAYSILRAAVDMNGRLGIPTGNTEMVFEVWQLEMNNGWRVLATLSSCDGPNCTGEISYHHERMSSSNGISDIWVQARYTQPQQYGTTSFTRQRLLYRFACNTRQFVIVERQIMGDGDSVVATQQFNQSWRTPSEGDVAVHIARIACPT